MRILHVLPLATLALLAACGDGSELGGDVTGSWRAIPSSRDITIPVAERATWHFGDNGAFEVRRAGTPTRTGNWTIDGERLTVDLGPIPPAPQPSWQASRATEKYAVDGDHLLVGMLEPVGEVEGMVGTWRRDSVVDDGEAITNIYRLRADGTGTLGETLAQAPTDTVFTWTETPTDVTVTWMNPPGWDAPAFEMTHMKMPASDLVGGVLLERVE